MNTNIRKCCVHRKNEGKKKKSLKIYKDIVKVLSVTPGIISQKVTEGKLDCREATN